MSALNSDPEVILHELALLPTASFHEEAVARFIRKLLSEHEIRFALDPYGNIIAHYRLGNAPQPLALVAHMDHPAFEVASSQGDQCEALLLGGVLNDYFAPGAPVRVFTTSGTVAGEVRGIRSAPDPPAGLAYRTGRQAGQRQVLLSLRTAHPVAAGDWGVWEMTDFRQEGDLLHLRAADDLAGCAVVLSTLLSLQEQQAEGDVYGVFTRAEEVGLLGALLVAQQRLLPDNTVVVSVESSRALPGAQVGEGPVIRVGDFRRTFHHEAEAFLLAGWEALRRSDPDVKVQRQLLSGGTCEATAFSLLGYRSTGVALPLGNYHNMGPNSTLAPEFIHRRDLAGAEALLTKAVECARTPLQDPLLARYGQVSQEHQSRLQETARRWSL